jgi:hypothetical protein
MMNYLSWITCAIAALLFYSCSNSYQCTEKSMKTIFWMEESTTMTIKDSTSETVAYYHAVLAEGLKRRCLDSALVWKMVNKYISTTDKQPVSAIHIFNAVEGYDRGENLSQSKRFFKNQVMSILFNTSTGKPDGYVFYDRSGDILYKSATWRRQTK